VARGRFIDGFGKGGGMTYEGNYLERLCEKKDLIEWKKESLLERGVGSSSVNSKIV